MFSGGEQFRRRASRTPGRHGGGRAVRLLRRRAGGTWAAARHDPAHLVAHFRTHVAHCRTAGMGFNLLLNPVCLGGYEENTGLERRLRRTMARAAGMGVTAVTVAASLAGFIGARDGAACARGRVRWGRHRGTGPLLGDPGRAHYCSGHPRAVSRSRRHQAHRRGDARRDRGAGQHRLHPALPAGAHPRGPALAFVSARNPTMDPCVRWCMEEKRRDPVNLIRSDFIRPEDLDQYPRTWA